jgi:hypothetical protein
MRLKTIYDRSLLKDALVFVDPADSELLESLSKKNTRDGEEGLMLAVLEDAIEYFQEYLLAKDKKGKELFQEAEEWILEKNSDRIFSFKHICEVLELDPDYVRRGLLRWKEAKRKGRHKAKIYSTATGKKTKKSVSTDARRPT